MRPHPSFGSPVPILMEPMPTSPRESVFVIPNIVISPVDPAHGHTAVFNYQNGSFKYKEEGPDSGTFNELTLIHNKL